jgi:hypothetical protein
MKAAILVARLRLVKPTVDCPSTFCDVMAMPACAPCNAEKAVLQIELVMVWVVLNTFQRFFYYGDFD